MIAFERGKDPKSGLGIGIEGMKKKYRILVIESEFRDLKTACNSLFGADQFGGLGLPGSRNPFEPKGTMGQLQDANFVIIANKEKFRIVKSRYAPAHSEMSPSSMLEFVENWDYPEGRINDCIMWMVKESEKWNKDV